MPAREDVLADDALDVVATAHAAVLMLAWTTLLDSHDHGSYNLRASLVASKNRLVSRQTDVA
jgi:hypothetical protein